MVACLQGLDSHRASNTANTDNWVEEDTARTRMPVFIVSHCVSAVIFPNLFFFIRHNRSAPITSRFVFFLNVLVLKIQESCLTQTMTE